MDRMFSMQMREFVSDLLTYSIERLESSPPSHTSPPFHTPLKCHFVTVPWPKLLVVIFNLSTTRSLFPRNQ